MPALEPIPQPVADAARFMSSFERPWALCGGWAVDAWLGRVTRSHLDVDITLFVEDAPALLAGLPGWHFVAHDELEPLATTSWDGRALELPAHIHARPPGSRNLEILTRWVTPPGHQAGEDGLDYDFELNEREGGACVLSRDPRIEIPMAGLFRHSPWGVPALAPEVIAYYKATAYYRERGGKERPHDLPDFEAMAALLDASSRRWLHAAITSRFAGHQWLPLFD